MARLTVTDLIEQKRKQSQSDTYYGKAIHSDVLGGEIVAKRLPLRQVTAMIDRLGQDESTTSQLEVNLELIYKSCDIFHDSELMTECGVEGDRYDVVAEVFNNNLQAIGDFADEIMKFYYSHVPTVDELKN